MLFCNVDVSRSKCEVRIARYPMCRGHSSSMMSISRAFLALVAISYCRSTIALHANRHRRSSHNKPKMAVPVSSDQGHPNLYFSAEDVRRLRDRVNTSHAGLYKKLVKIARASETSLRDWQEFSTKWNVVYGNTLAVLATYCVLTPRDQKSLAMAKRYMERLARLPSWRVEGHQVDDVPVAHSLLGFVTAFDFLHASLARNERARYLAKTRAVCRELYAASIKKWWGSSYIQNHVATNYVALFTAAVVVSPYYPGEASAWLDRSVVALDKTMTLLRLVVDGSFQEGVSYGSYTSRSLTQFMYLAERHLNQSYRDNNWVREHFNFLLYSTLPGYQKTVGIADSNKDWAYGPESQLTFLENYVHRDGRAIWLANQIKSCRPASRMVNLLSYTHSTLYTEILFYNNSLKETASDEVKLHVFSDWGVITYGGGTPAGNTFLSFKCGRLHGRAINMLWRNLSKTRSSRLLNPGHEQPDHGSFVYIANEQPVITESFYGPKFTFLENVLMFGHSRKPSCSSPYLGQLGECQMWLNHKDRRTWQAVGELVGYSQHGGVIFMSGDMTGWYDQSLGLQSVYRALVMLSPSVLVVVDTIRLQPESPTTHVSAFFHNADLPFNRTKNERSGENPCAKVGRYSMCWVHHNGHTVNVTMRNNFTVKRARFATNFINVTSRFRGNLSSTAYIFHGPNDVLDDAKVLETRGGDGVSINLKMNSGAYDITLSARHGNPRLRRRLLGSSGYGNVRVNRSARYELGLKTAPCDVAQEMRTSSDTIERVEAFAYLSAAYGVAQLTSFVAMLCWFLHFTRRFGLHPYIRWTMIALFILWLTTFLCFSTKSILSTSPGSLPSGLKPSTANKDADPYQRGRPGARTPCTRLPPQCQAVVAIGLPLSGAEIAREIFTTNTDFAVLDVPSTNVVTPSEFLLLKEKLDLCEWRENDDSRLSFNTSTNMAEFVEWWKQILRNPWKIRKNVTKDYISLKNPLGGNKYEMEVTKSEGALAFVHFKNPGWLFRISWLNTRFLADSFTPVLYLVRDPRSWIEHLLSEHDYTFPQQLDRALRKDDHCNPPSDILAFREVYDAGMKPHVVLAHIWVAFTSYASKLMATLPSGRFRIVRLEDLISAPKETSEDVYSFLRMPFPAAVEHRILQVTKSEILELENYGVINQQFNSWGKILSDEQVVEIERICRNMMSRIGYT